MLALLLATLCLAAEPQWPGRVRVQGPAASGDGLGWDPALTEARPADDRELAWDAAAVLETRAGAWYQRVFGLRILRPPRALDPEVLDADRARVVDFFAHRGFPDAAAAVTVLPTANPRVSDVVFVVTPGERTGARSPLPEAEPAQGWDVRPVVNALGRGATMSAYGGVHADWTQPADRPNGLDFHGEVGVRAFPDPSADVPYGGNVGLWSLGEVTWYHRVAPGVTSFTSLRNQTDLWPAHNEATPSVGMGLRIGDAALALEGGARVGLWTSWAWNGQFEAYDPWFEGTPLGEGQPHFVRRYGYARLDVSLTADTTDRAVLPRRGARIAIRATPVGMAAGAVFTRAAIDARGFVPLVGQRWIWAVRGQAGALDWNDPAGRSLMGERFFLGASDLKAWGRRRVVPPGYAGDAYDLRPGGDLVAFGNTEVRWHVHRDLAVAVFVDAGRVWNDVSQITVASLLWDGGLAVSVPSPLGSVRVDAAIPLRHQDIDGNAPVVLQLWLDEPW